MRLFEALLWLIAAGWCWTLIWRPREFSFWRWVAMLSAVVVGFHATSEGVRTQMVPLYGMTLVLIVASAVTIRRPRGAWVRVTMSGIAALLLAVAGAAPSLFPVYEYEKPSGPYGIGTADYEVPGATGGRTLVVQAWYPIAPGTIGDRAALTSRVDLLEGAYASFSGIPRVMFDNLRLIRTHAIRRAPLASHRQRLPVLLFSHGPLAANRTQSVFLMEALASSGFVVVAIDHTGYASTTIFPDGHAVPAGDDATWPVFVDARSSAMLRTWVGDVRNVLDRLTHLDAHDPEGLLTGRLDLSRVGYVGASFGGSVVVEALRDEPRIKAGVAQDGKPYFFDETPSALRKPLMYMQSAAPYIPTSDSQLARWGLTRTTFRVAEQDHYARQMRLFGESAAPIYNVYVRGTDHVTFSDLYLILNLPSASRISVRRAHQIINAYTVAFFERYLNDSPQTLVDEHTPSPFPEVTVARRNVAVAGRTAN
jgi:predicted dienelactone hydrolase